MKGLKVLRMDGEEFGQVNSIIDLGRWLDDLFLCNGNQQQVRICCCRSPILNGKPYAVVAKGNFKISPVEEKVRVVRRGPAMAIKLDSQRLVLVPADLTHLVS